MDLDMDHLDLLMEVLEHLVVVDLMVALEVLVHLDKVMMEEMEMQALVKELVVEEVLVVLDQMELQA
jgi:hypothetical protein